MPLERFPMQVRRSATPVTWTKVAIMADENLVQRYTDVLPLFRMKWLEVQGNLKVIQGHSVTAQAPTAQDVVAFGTSCRRFRLVQAEWVSRVMRGTRLYIDDVYGHVHLCHVRRIAERTVMFVTRKTVLISEIASMYIIRGEEPQTVIMEHLRVGEQLLSSSTASEGGAQFVATHFSLPKCSSAEFRAYLSNEVAFAKSAASEIYNGYWKEDPHMTHAKFRRVVAQRRAHIREVYRVVRAELEDGPKYMELNPEQHAVTAGAFIKPPTDVDQWQSRADKPTLVNRDASSSAHRGTTPGYIPSNTVQHCVTICEGYPGTGKTCNMGGLVLRRFCELLTQDAGVILCLTMTNAAALQMVKHIVKYECLQEHVTYAYSKPYYAFHESDFADVYQYRLTPKGHIGTHAIIVCTLGMLPVLLERYPSLPGRVFDAVLDESGQLWDFDALLFLPKLYRLMRLFLFGDLNQLAPYVTKLLGTDQQFRAIMAMFKFVEPNTPLTPFVARLVIQYRMYPSLCQAHAPVFYDYKIVSARAEPADRSAAGPFFERVPDQAERKGISFEDYETERSLEIAQEIWARRPSTDHESEYTICVLTPYLASQARIMRRAAELKFPKCFTVRTVDSCQGCEFDAVIVTTGARTKVTDLLLCRQRGNVAMSRAKDIMVVLAHRDFMVKTDQGQGRLYFWGEVISSSLTRSFKEHDSRTQDTLEELRLIRSIPRNNRTSRECRHRKVPKVVHYARHLLSSNSYRSVHMRPVICRQLCLKRTRSLCRDLHKNMYYYLMRCSEDQLHQILKVYVTQFDHKARHAAIARVLGVDLFQRPSVAIESVIDRVFTNA